MQTAEEKAMLGKLTGSSSTTQPEPKPRKRTLFNFLVGSKLKTWD
jgi:hypothetical protein